MESSKKRKLAALIGIMRYLDAEKDDIKPIKQFMPTLPTLWACYGRQQIMSNNQLMQRRVFRR